MTNNDQFEKFNLVNNAVKTEEVFDYIGSKIFKEDAYRITYACPYHTDDLPSLNVDVGSGRFNCFACDNKGGGSYAAAKYYLEQQAGTKVGQLAVIDFLIQINPALEIYKPMFTIKQKAKYERGVNKAKNFRQRIKSNDMTHSLVNNVQNLTVEEKKVFIDAIMTGMDVDFIAQNIITSQSKEDKGGSQEFLDLLGED